MGNAFDNEEVTTLNSSRNGTVTIISDIAKQKKCIYKRPLSLNTRALAVAIFFLITFL